MGEASIDCIICMGSNTEPSFYLAKARSELCKLFPNILFGDELETEPECCGLASPLYHNQCAKFSTDIPLISLLRVLKDIEKTIGRRENDKENNTIHIDIDLLEYGQELVKMSDRYKNYVVKCLATL